jgi:hypothetical protein
VRNRTADLIPTKDALYQLSYNGILIIVEEFPRHSLAVARSFLALGVAKSLLARICRRLLRKFSSENFLAHCHPFESPLTLSHKYQSNALTGIALIFVWAERDSNPRRRKPSGLQPDPVDRFGIYPCRVFALKFSIHNSQFLNTLEPPDGLGPTTCCLQNSCSTN